MVELLYVTKSDGTEEGTVLVKDINPGSEGSDFEHAIAIGSTLYFSATDGTHGKELWKSDGTEAGTVMLEEINPGPEGSDPGSRMTSIDETLYFTATNPTYGNELWKFGPVP